MKPRLAALAAIMALLMGAAAHADTARRWTRDEWETAEALHKNRCADCHRLYEPSDYSESEWKERFKTMKRKARLSLKESRLLSDYTNALRRNEKFDFKRQAVTPDKRKTIKRKIYAAGL